MTTLDALSPDGWRTWPRVAAAAISLVALACVTVVPVLQGPTVFSPSVALNWLGLVAVAWAAAFAADNLTELKAARLAEILPLVDVGLRRGYDAGESQLVLSFRNLGRGHASGFEATIWQLDVDGLYWIPERLSDLPDLIAPSQVLTEIRKKNDWIKYALQEQPCDLIVEAVFRDPMRKHHALTLGFKIGGLMDEMSEVAVPARPSVDAKLAALREMLARIEQDYSLADARQCLTVDAEGKAMIVNYLGENGGIVAWNAPIGTAIYEMEERVRRGVEANRVVVDEQEQVEDE